MRNILILTLALSALPAGAALAQESGVMSEGMAMSEGVAMTEETVTLPAACEEAAGSTDMSQMMGGMEGMMPGEGMSDVVKANMGAMMKMHEPMMKAMMIEDADLAFNCGMIAHHQGAIAMAQVELEMGSDEESKALAEKIIEDQQREIEEMTAWVEEHAAQ